jgi:hypothetical protein
MHTEPCSPALIHFLPGFALSPQVPAKTLNRVQLANFSVLCYSYSHRENFAKQKRSLGAFLEPEAMAGAGDVTTHGNDIVSRQPVKPRRDGLFDFWLARDG